MSDVGDFNEWVNVAQNDGRDACIPQFYMNAKQRTAESEKAGRPIFHQIPYVRILVPGDKNAQVDRKVKDEDKQRWPDAWKRFQDRQDSALDGTPIEHWPYLNVAQVAEFKALNIFTVESLATLTDAGLEKIGLGAREIQKRAQAFLQPASDTEQNLREEVRDLKTKVSDLESKLEQKRRGRPPKIKKDDFK